MQEPQSVSQRIADLKLADEQASVGRKLRLIRLAWSNELDSATTSQSAVPATGDVACDRSPVAKRRSQ